MGLLYLAANIEKYHLVFIRGQDKDKVIRDISDFTTGIIPFMIHFIEIGMGPDENTSILVEKKGSEKMINFLLIKYSEKTLQLVKDHFYMNRDEIVKIERILGHSVVYSSR